MLEKKNKKGNVFKIAKQMVKKNKGVVGGGGFKDAYGKIVVEESKIK